MFGYQSMLKILPVTTATTTIILAVVFSSIPGSVHSTPINLSAKITPQQEDGSSGVDQTGIPGTLTILPQDRPRLAVDDDDLLLDEDSSLNSNNSNKHVRLLFAFDWNITKGESFFFPVHSFVVSIQNEVPLDFSSFLPNVLIGGPATATPAPLTVPANLAIAPSPAKAPEPAKNGSATEPDSNKSGTTGGSADKPKPDSKVELGPSKDENKHINIYVNPTIIQGKPEFSDEDKRKLASEQKVIVKELNPSDPNQPFSSQVVEVFPVQSENQKNNESSAQQQSMRLPLEELKEFLNRDRPQANKPDQDNSKILNVKQVGVDSANKNQDEKHSSSSSSSSEEETLSDAAQTNTKIKSLKAKAPEKCAIKGHKHTKHSHGAGGDDYLSPSNVGNGPPNPVRRSAPLPPSPAGPDNAVRPTLPDVAPASAHGNPDHPRSNPTPGAGHPAHMVKEPDSPLAAHPHSHHHHHHHEFETPEEHSAHLVEDSIKEDAGNDDDPPQDKSPSNNNSTRVVRSPKAEGDSSEPEGEVEEGSENEEENELSRFITVNVNARVNVSQENITYAMQTVTNHKPAAGIQGEFLVGGPLDPPTRF